MMLSNLSYTRRDSTYICFFREHCPELHGLRGKPFPGKESPKPKAPQPRRVQVSVSRRVGLYWPTPLVSERVFTTAPANSRDTTTSMSDNFIEMTSFATKRGDPPSHQNQNSKKGLTVVTE
jgi:hypothetical protein